MNATVPPSVSWRLARPAGLSLRHWAGEPEAVVYDPAAGQTHLVDEVSHALLTALGAGAQPLSVLAERFADWFEPGTDGAARERYLHDALDHLRAAGLVAAAAGSR